MLDIGWSELLVIGVVSLIVVGPKDLPKLFKAAGEFTGRARGMAREFQRSMEAAADDSGLKEVSNSLKGIDRLNMNAATKSARKYAEGLVKGGDTSGKDAPATSAPVPNPVPNPASPSSAAVTAPDSIAGSAVGSAQDPAAS